MRSVGQPANGANTIAATNAASSQSDEGSPASDERRADAAAIKPRGRCGAGVVWSGAFKNPSSMPPRAVSVKSVKFGYESPGIDSSVFPDGRELRVQVIRDERRCS